MEWLICAKCWANCFICIVSHNAHDYPEIGLGGRVICFLIGYNSCLRLYNHSKGMIYFKEWCSQVLVIISLPQNFAFFYIHIHIKSGAC